MNGTTMAIEDLPRIRSESTKYDGSLHYEFDTYLLDYEDGCLRLYLPAGTPNRSYRGDGMFEADCIALFFPGDNSRRFNVFHYLTPYPQSGLLTASDMLRDVHLDGSTLRWIDVDLDVEVSADGRVELVDEDEFQEHQVRYGYPPHVIAEAIESSEIALKLARSAAVPFARDHLIAEVEPLIRGA